jgi:nucleoside-diphosphate-sugar epimerase
MWVIGASGRLGSGLLSASGRIRNLYASPIAREHYIKWDSKSKAKLWLSASGFMADDVMVNASGITDASSSQAALERANVELPTIAAQAAIELGGSVLTLGSVLEQSKAMTTANPYVKTKHKLATNAKQSSNWTHLQIHTVYGGKVPTPHMFTGLMFRAIQDQKPLRMTAGHQIREYHHVEDISIAIINLTLRTKLPKASIIEMSSANHIELRHLATETFAAFNSLPLLEIDTNNIPLDDIYTQCPKTMKNKIILNTRPIVPALVEWFQSHLSRNGN